MSGSQNRSCCNIIYRLGLNIVMLLTLLLSMLLFAGSFLTTCYADNMETQQVLLRPDNLLWNLLVANFTNPLPPIPLTGIESQMISRSWRLANSAETKLAPLQPVSKMKRSVLNSRQASAS